MQASDATEIEGVFRALDREVWIVTAAAGPRRGGLAATWVMQASLDPARPLAVAGLASNHHTTELVLASGACALHLVGAEQAALALRFALGSGRDHDKLAGLGSKPGVTGAPVLDDCPAWLEGRVLTQFDTGDRRYLWLEIVAGRRRDHRPLLREGGLLAAASPAERAALRAGLQADLGVQTPLAERWLAALALV